MARVCGAYEVLDASGIERFWSQVAPMWRGSAADLDDSALEAAANALSEVAPQLTLEGARLPGGFELIFGARGVRRHFPLAHAFVAKAPAVPGVRVRALARARALPECVGREGAELPLTTARVHVERVLQRYGVLLLTRGVKISDYVAFRNLAKSIVMDVLGEERFGLFVTDVQVMDHADWEAGAGAAQSFPLSELTRLIPHAGGDSPDPQIEGAAQDNQKPD